MLAEKHGIVTDDKEIADVMLSYFIDITIVTRKEIVRIHGPSL